MRPTEKLSPRCVLVFDLDGVIINSRPAVKAAYSEAGIEMPDEMWGKPWRVWCDEQTHTRKNAVYSDMLQKHSKPGPLLWMVDKLKTEALVLTGASSDAVHIVKRILDVSFTVLGCEQTKEQKVFTLSKLAETQQVVYFDDDAGVISYMNQFDIKNLTCILVNTQE